VKSSAANGAGLTATNSQARISHTSTTEECMNCSLEKNAPSYQGAISNFAFGGAPVRVVVVGGAPWFVAADVCAALTIGNSRMALERLDDDEKGVSSVDTLGGAQCVAVVNESGLYSLILGSRKPEARRFKKWVTSEVLPAIRKTGSYSVAPVLPRSFAEALRLAADQAEQLERQRPAVEFVGRYVEGTGLMGVRQVAKLLKANEREFVEWLEARGVMYRLAGRLTPMANHMDAGRFEVKTGAADNGHAFTSSRFTPKGVEWVAGEWGKRMALQQLGGEAA
jgi:prophage antirepressor-like protein